jgi:hypothetical protein
LGIDRRPQLGAGLRVDLGVEVPHASDLVDPAAQRRVHLLTFELADPAVAGEQPGEIAAVLVELGDRVAGGSVQEVGFEYGELGATGVVEVACGIGQRVDMARRDRAVGEGIFEGRQLVAYRGAVGGGLGILAGASTAPSQHPGRRGVDTRASARRDPPGDGHVDGVDPPAHPCT